ncbi:ATP-binding protein [Sphingobium sp. CFD-2]|uniref:ATP-binding protein n=1 Tax=Sphingobium sp. CFD-2 TaxID=2878542 RepID=UPI00214C02DD|nr:ATP-binding protein [Sphingobium sp. CFD-2]
MDIHDDEARSDGDDIQSFPRAERWSCVARAISQLSAARDLAQVVEVLRKSARAAARADGIAVVLRDGDQCHHLAEDAMDSLWTGKRFPLDSCVSGWTMRNGKTAAIADIRTDARVPQEAYRATFVKSMVMVPIGLDEPVAALGAYWASTGHPDGEERAILETLAQAASTALSHGRLVAEMAELNRNLETRIKERTQELEAAHQSLVQTQKLELMGQLTGSVAHDFNNLLSPIMTSLDLILQTGSRGQAALEPARVAMEAVERARALVQRLLAFARRRPLAHSVIDVRALLKGMRPLLESTVGARIQIQSIIPPDLPNIMGDRQQLEIAILNLVVNARDAMPEGGSLAISASYPSVPQGRSDREDAFIRLSVRDEGEGMDEATRAMVLEPFFTTKAPGSGTGLGLPMVHGVVQELGGLLDISSEPGAGTEVSLWLPITQDRVSHLPVQRIEPVRPAAQGVAMVVDDHHLVRRGTVAMLREDGYEVLEFDSARACLDQLEKGVRPDILIADHVMPGMTGLDLVRHVSQAYPQTPLVLVSGHDGLEAAPADVVRLAKPFRQHELQAGIARARRQAELPDRDGGIEMTRFG